MHFDIYSIFNPPPSLKILASDFKVSQTDINGTWIRLEELHDMINKGIIQVDTDKLNEFTESWRYVKLK